MKMKVLFWGFNFCIIVCLLCAGCGGGGGSGSMNSTTTSGKANVTEQNKNTKSSWCDVTLDKVNYSPGETLYMSIKGYNYDTTALKCGVKIILQKGQGETQVWISDFSDTSTYITLAPGVETSGTIQKVIPTTWAPTNTSEGSAYRVYTIREDGTEWGKGDNFNIMRCVVACSTDSECDDGNALTIDICNDPGTCSANCTHTPCTPACTSDIDCNDNNNNTIDLCKQPNTCSAYCENPNYCTSEFGTPMTIASDRHGGAIYNGKIYIIGGRKSYWEVLDKTQVYDPAVDTWSFAAPLLPYPKYDLSAVTLGDDIYAIGGSWQIPTPLWWKTVRDTYKFNPQTNQWTKMADLPGLGSHNTGIAYATAQVVNGKIYLIGGQTALHNYYNYTLNNVYEYNPATNVWNEKSSLPVRRRAPISAVYNNVIYVMGGFFYEHPSPIAYGPFPETFAYDVNTDTWTQKASMPQARYSGDAVVINGKIYVFGGIGVNGLTGTDKILIYDPATDTWESTYSCGQLLRFEHSVGTIGNTVYIAGGRITYDAIDDVELIRFYQFLP
ncbi:MAG: kelch repeat-containing protein [bacterium]